jgi:hypothetical protein
MPLLNRKRKPENWLAQIEEVKARISRRKTRQRRKAQLASIQKKEREARNARLLGRRLVRQKLRWAREAELLLMIQARQKQWSKRGPPDV